MKDVKQMKNVNKFLSLILAALVLCQPALADVYVTHGGGGGGGTVTSVTGTAPIVSSGGATPAISLSNGVSGQALQMNSNGGTYLAPGYGTPTGSPTLPQRSPKWRTAIARVAAGTGFADILCCGDSPTSGTGAGGTNPRATTSYAAQLRQRLNSAGIPTSEGVIWATNDANVDTRWIAGGGTNLTGAGFGNGGYWNCTPGGGGTNLLPGFLCDSIKIYYVQWSGGSSFDTVLDVVPGGNPALFTKLGTTNTNGSAAWSSVTYTFPRGMHTFGFSNISGGTSANILGALVWDSTTPSVRISNAGASSSLAADWAATSTTFGSGAGDSIDGFAAVAPDAVVMAESTNDWAVPTTFANYKTSMQAVLAAIQSAGADILLLSDPPSNVSVATLALQQQYDDQMRQWAETYSAGFVDIIQRWTSNAVSSGLYSDTKNPNAAGYYDFSSLIASAFGINPPSLTGPVPYAANTVTQAYNGATVQAPGGGVLNSAISPLLLPHWRKAIANVINQTGDAKVLLIGDSTYRISEPTSSALLGITQRCIPARVRQMFARYLPSVEGVATPSGSTAGLDATANDPRYVLSSGWTMQSSTAIVGGVSPAPTGFANTGWIQGATSAGADLTFTPEFNTTPYTFDTLKIYYFQQSGGGTFTYNVDGGSTLATVNTANAATNPQVSSVSVSRGTHVVHINPPTVGNVAIAGIECLDSTISKIRVTNAASSGANLAAFVTPATASLIDNGMSSTLYQPDLVIIAYGVNDAAGGSSAAVICAELNQAIKQYQSQGADVVIMSPTNYAAHEALVKSYSIAELPLCQASGCGFIDWFGRWVSSAQAVANGFQYSDATHPLYAGSTDVAVAILQALGASNWGSQ